MIPDDEKMVGPWEPVGETWDVNVEVPTIVNGFGAPVQTVRLPVLRRIERRKVWRFVGYEERVVES